MNITIEAVPQEHILSIWDTVKPFIERVVDNIEDSDYSTEHVLAYLMIEQWMLIIAYDEHNYILGVATVQLIDYPFNRVAFITGVSGRGIVNRYNYEKLKSLLKQYGASKIQGYGRASITRLYRTLDINFKATLLEAII